MVDSGLISDGVIQRPRHRKDKFSPIILRVIFPILPNPLIFKDIRGVTSSEVESSTTSLASRTYFEVLILGLRLEASSLWKLPCPRLEDSTIFCTVEILLENVGNIAENLRRPFLFSSNGNHLEKFFKNLFYFILFFWRSPEKVVWRPFFFLRTLAPVSLVLGLGLGFFCVLGLEPYVLNSTSGHHAV